MKRSILALGLACVGVLAWANVSRATDTIYTDNFDGTAGNLSGRALDTAAGIDGGTAGATWTSDSVTASNPDAIWQASGGTYTGTGSTLAAIGAFATGADSNLITNAYVPLVPQSGLLYDVHMAVAPSGTGASGNWLGMAFAGNSGSGTFFNGHTTGGASSALSNDSTIGLIILKGSGVVQSFGGTTNSSGQITSSTANQEFNTAAGFIPTGTSTPTYTPVDMYLDTRGSQWVISWSINGATSGADFATYTYPVGDNPTTISDIVFGTNKLTGDLSDFSVTATPEPVSAMALLGLFAMAHRTRRRA